MAHDKELLGTSAKFNEVLEAKIEAGEGMFEEPHPFLRTALRGLAKRLNTKIAPIGFVMVTELYVNDMNTGNDGFTGEPMPSDVTGMPPVMNGILRIAADEIAKEAFGQEFSDAAIAIRTDASSPKPE